MNILKSNNLLNKKSNSLLNTYYIFVIIPFIIFIFIYITITKDSHTIFPKDSTSMIDINTGWKNKTGKELDINPLLSNKEIQKGKTYTLYHKIPKETKVGDSLCFRGLSTNIKIYIGNKQIINTPYKKHILSCKSPGNVWYFYTFKENDLNKTLKMTVNPYYNDTSCYIDNMYIGSSTTYIQKLILTNLIPIIIALLILFLGIIYIILDLFICMK